MNEDEKKEKERAKNRKFYRKLILALLGITTAAVGGTAISAKFTGKEERQSVRVEGSSNHIITNNGGYVIINDSPTENHSSDDEIKMNIESTYDQNETGEDEDEPDKEDKAVDLYESDSQSEEGAYTAEASSAVDIDTFDTTSTSTDDLDEYGNNEIRLRAHAWGNEAAYKEYRENEEPYYMAGIAYRNGFVIKTGASFNLWGDGSQYAVFNISRISELYSTIEMMVGHVDEYSSGNVILGIYLDRNIDGSPDYEYTIYPELNPQKIEINIIGRQSMTIKLDNQGGEGNGTGFADICFL